MALTYFKVYMYLERLSKIKRNYQDNRKPNPENKEGILTGMLQCPALEIGVSRLR
jgi:hypothetical protein